MFRLSDNYYHRKCYLEREQVPTQTVMKNVMGSSLANVYFKSMKPELKVLAGLEPRLAGGGSEWHVQPKEILKGRAVLKPVKLEHLRKMGCSGLIEIGEELREKHYAAMIQAKRQAVIDSDIKWKRNVLETNRKQYDDDSKQCAIENTIRLQNAVREFEVLYKNSLIKIESMAFEAALAEITRTRQETFENMKEHYARLLEYQSITMYDEYDAMLKETKAKLKAKFIKDADTMKTDVGNLLHDINVEKHTIIEKTRHMLECQNLACQTYVALKEREECKKETELIKHDHGKKMKKLKENEAMIDFDIVYEMEQHAKRQEFIMFWKKKVCQVVKKFQMFVDYCFKKLPEHADFFLNMERLMMLQINEAAENPDAASIIEEEPGFITPIPKPHPYYLFCDKIHKPPHINQNLCPKHCTSSASHLPVVVINKSYIYSACDKFEVYADKVVQFLAGHKGDDADLEDGHRYEFDVPVKYTPSAQLKELKLESSIMQIIQKELPNTRKLPLLCGYCKIPYCFCSPLRQPASEAIIQPIIINVDTTETKSISSGNKIKTRSAELQLQREPKWESYFDYVASKKCRCAKTAKKHLQEHLPSYMTKMSPFESPELPNYEPVRMETLKLLVKRAKGKCTTPPPTPEKVESKTRDVGCQYSDQEFDFLCDCFSDDAVAKIFEAIIKDSKLFSSKPTDDTRGPVICDCESPMLTKTASYFATKRAYSLRKVIGQANVLQEIFKKKSCDFKK